jgi:hypothetical protein
MRVAHEVSLAEAGFQSRKIALQVAKACEPSRSAEVFSGEQSSQLGLLLGAVGNHSDWKRGWHLKANLASFFLSEAATKLNELSSGLGLLFGDKYC